MNRDRENRLTQATRLDNMARAIQEAARLERAAAHAYAAGDGKSARGLHADARAALHEYPATLAEAFTS